MKIHIKKSILYALLGIPLATYSFFFFPESGSLAINMLLSGIGFGFINLSLQTVVSELESPKKEVLQKIARVICLILLLFLLISTISFFIFIHLFFSN